MLFEELSEEALVGEMELLGDFLDAQRRILQHDAGLENDIVVNPFVGRATAYLLY